MRRCRRRRRKVVGHQIYKFSPEGKLLLTLGKAGGNQPGAAGRSGVVLSAERRHHERQGRDLRLRGPLVDCDGARAHHQVRSHRQVHQGVGQARHAHPASSTSRTRSRGTRRAGCSSRIDRTTASRSSIRTARCSITAGSSTAASAACGSTRTTCSTPPTPSPARSRPARSDWTRGIRIGSIRDGKHGKIQFFIPDPAAKPPSTSAAEGVAVDAAGNIYGAEVGPRALKKYVKK